VIVGLAVACIAVFTVPRLVNICDCYLAP
jgi:hypothetical protein